MKLNFYSAKSGKVYPFFNLANNAITTEEKMYFKLLLNQTTMEYSFVQSGATITAREIVNPSYFNLINSTVQSVPLEIPVYPTGNTFTENGIYINQ